MVKTWRGDTKAHSASISVKTLELLLRMETELYTQRWLEIVNKDPNEGIFADLYLESSKAINEISFMSVIFNMF